MGSTTWLVAWGVPPPSSHLHVPEYIRIITAQAPFVYQHQQRREKINNLKKSTMTASVPVLGAFFATRNVSGLDFKRN